MGQNYSYKRNTSRDDSAQYMRDYNVSQKTKKILARLSLALLVILFAAGFFLSDYIGEELAMIMMAAPIFLMFVWFLVVWLYKGEPPPTFGPPIDINAEFGKQYFQSPEDIAKAESASRMSRLPENAPISDSVVKIIE